MGRSSSRLISLDVMRGATIAGMILVNNPGSWAHVHPQLRHAAWHGWTLTDLIFPFFLFIVGVAIVFSLGSARDRGRSPRSQLGRVVRRSARLIFFGLLMAAWGGASLADVRIPGVLQRISVCYLLGALAFLYIPRDKIRWLLVSLLLGYWALLVLVPVPGFGPGELDRPDATLAAWLDRLVLGDHLWSQTGSWDPEGILSTLSALATVLLGIEVGYHLRSRGADASGVARLVAAGALLTALGLVWDRYLPVNKSLWTGSFVLFTGGLAMLALALLLWVVELRRWRLWTHPFVVFGRNAITVFVMSGLLARTLSRLRVQTDAGEVSLKQRYYELLFTSWLPPDAASLVHAFAWVFFCYLVVWWMFRKGVFLRI